MKKIMLSVVTLTTLAGSLTLASAADATATKDEGFKIFDNIKYSAQIRPRYEYANVLKNGKDPAQSLTARTKLKVSAGLFEVENLTATVAVISVNNFGWNEYDSKSPYYNPGAGQYDVIKDPQYAMIAEAAIDYKIDKTTLHAGRSNINLDNQRFIGTVGWRQLERSYDTVYVADNSIEGLKLLGAWVYGFQGVGAGPTTDSNSILLHASYEVMPQLKITAYDYMLASIHDTLGVAVTGKIEEKKSYSIKYRAEYAMQSDATMEIHGNSAKADAQYMNFDLSANVAGVLVGANYELLSGADSNGKTTFTPTLGTNHKFNGWADVFYVASTPSGGLQDMNAHVGYKAKGLGKVLAVYHMFTADTAMPSASGTTDDLGTEIDLLYANAIPGVKNLKGLVKFAAYSAGKATGYTNDKKVGWVQLDYKF